MPAHAAIPASPEREALARFVDLLEREQVALARPASADLQAYADEKLALADHIEALRRKQPRGARSTDPVVADLARRARRLNETNGRLIALHLQAVTARLQALEMRERPVDALYQANGLRAAYA
jgi:flagellar biosynthesis/type III secretory pathway chaperone